MIKFLPGGEPEPDLFSRLQAQRQHHTTDLFKVASGSLFRLTSGRPFKFDLRSSSLDFPIICKLALSLVVSHLKRKYTLQPFLSFDV